MRKYFSTEGGMTRSEFFRGWIFGCLILTILMALARPSGAHTSDMPIMIPVVIGTGFLFMLGLVPLWMAARLRDAGHSGKWAFLVLLFFPFPILFFTCLLIPTKKSV